MGPGVLGVEQVLHPKHLLRLALIGEGSCAAFHPPRNRLLDRCRPCPFRRHAGEPKPPGRPADTSPGAAPPGRNDQRRAGFVDEDRIHLINHALLKLPLHHLRNVGGHVVAQVVEAQLRIGRIGDVAAVIAPPPVHVR